ncbi:hypothetical protein FNV43_RR14529 [Rhamnella rubrinervis]|uniref:Pentatricopeptide repeat-containing protein n=1 Tax=Rhamnella rubrinervis TaxID=2594499 RepID=A0A8K0H340_9ROSA|nr:hypothetical protein FNV43_RR14529 [Rhamnella rubrinervis]
MNGPSQALSRAKQFLFCTSATQCELLLQNQRATPSLKNVKQLHAHRTTSGLLTSHLSSILIKSYALCGHVPYTRKLFDDLSVRSSFLYNTLISLYVKSSLPYEAIQLFVDMLALGQCRPDKFTYPFVIKACGELSLLDVGAVVHGRTMVAGFDMDRYVQNSLLAMYMNCGEKEAAQWVFDAMQKPSVVSCMMQKQSASWNIMINGYFRNRCAKEAFMIFNRMKDVGVEPDCVTVVSLLPACGYMRNLVLGREVHTLVEEKGLGSTIRVNNALVDMYAKCGKMDEAQAVFDKMGERDVVTWTTMISGYILNDDARSALELCWPMQHCGIKPNSVTLSSLLSACGSLYLPTHGRCLHGWAIRQKLECDVVVETALIDMYAKCKYVDHSFRVFAKTTKKRTVPWNAILSGCIHNELAREALELFKQMLMEAVQPNDATLNSLLPAFSILADFRQAMNIHCYLIRSGFLSSVEVATGLVDIYSKCGSLECAHKIFNDIPNESKDIVLWSVIIAGYGMHGHGETAFSLFNQMVQSGVKPNQVTFTSVLHACSHSGLVDEGLHLLKYMLANHQVNAPTDHYTCIVDLLGRAGRLEEAYDIIQNIPFKPNHAIWGALLGACVIHENVELGEVAAKWLFELEPENTGNYVLLAKIYAAVGRWKDAENVRRMMGQIGLRKSPAQSVVGVRNT